MNKKFLLLASILLVSFSSFAQQEITSTSRSLIKDQANYGTQNQSYNQYKTAWKGNKFSDNWIFSIGGGAQRLFGKDNSVGNFGNNITFAPQITFTKYFSPIWGLRLSLSGGSLHGYNDGDSGIYRKWNHGSKHYLGQGYIGNVAEGYPSVADMGGAQNTAMLTWDPQWTYLGFRYNDPDPLKRIILTNGNTFQWDGFNQNKGLYYMKRIRYVQANIDFMFDLLNLISGYDQKRFFEVSPFGGIGVYNALAYRGSDNYMALGGHAGFLFKFRLTERLGVNAELSGSIVPDDFEGISGDKTSSSGIAQAIGSISYKIGKTNWDLVQPMDYDLINSLNNEINNLRDQNKRLQIEKAPIIVAAPPVKTVEEEQEDARGIKFLPDPVFFRINQAVIDNEQWSKIDKAATWLINNPKENVIITGYADKETGSPAYNMKISERRAKAVAEVLIQRYNINPMRISISWSGSEIQPFQINNWNRVVVFVIE